ncbi:MAG TPA: FAD-dependent oxidoreductase, partial [Pyrinomonadaceae bacterium]|nr:FAD-dependent oxidoreductase [Pyrinomonadaceae bacterium]
VEFTSTLTDKRSVARGGIVINAAGPWVDQVVGGRIELKSGNQSSDSKRLIGGTKGSHIIVDEFPGAPSTAIYVEAQTDQRPFFIIPWNRKFLIGTTDIRYDGDLDSVHIEENEIKYLLDETNRVIPTANLDRSKILYTYSGVRPLPFVGDKDEQSITRRHFIKSHPGLDNLFSIVGGKLTTYRSLAEEMVELVVRKLGRDSLKCTTSHTPLPGSKTVDLEAFAADFTKQYQMAATTCDHLLRTYGVAAASIMELVSEDSRLAEVIDMETGAIAAEVVHAFRHELAQTLSDCLLRRTMVGLNSVCGLNAVGAAASVAQNYLGWSNERAANEIITYQNHIMRARRVAA